MKLALRESKVTVFTQDRNLRYTSISNPLAGLAVDNIIGGTDESILEGDSLDAAAALKKAVLDTGTAKETDVSIRFQAGDVHWYEFACRATARCDRRGHRPDRRGDRRHHAQRGRSASSLVDA